MKFVGGPLDKESANPPEGQRWYVVAVRKPDESLYFTFIDPKNVNEGVNGSTVWGFVTVGNKPRESPKFALSGGFYIRDGKVLRYDLTRQFDRWESQDERGTSSPVSTVPVHEAGAGRSAFERAKSEILSASRGGSGVGVGSPGEARKVSKRRDAAETVSGSPGEEDSGASPPLRGSSPRAPRRERPESSGPAVGKKTSSIRFRLRSS